MATPKWYANGLLAIANGSVDLDSDTIKFALYTGSYTPDQAAHQYRSTLTSPTNYEASGGTGYTAGGWTLSNLGLTLSSLTLKWNSGSANPEISQAISGGPFAFRYGVFYKYRNVVSPYSTEELIGYVDFGAQSITDATLNITLTDQLQITAA